MSVRKMALTAILRDYRPGSHDLPWDWFDEAVDLLEMPCYCATVDPSVELIQCDTPGHYQRLLEQYIHETGEIPGGPICLGSDHRIWDGHHRIVAAMRQQDSKRWELEVEGP